MTAHDWTVVDEGWGRRARDFATLSEPANCREYVALHHLLGVDSGDRLLDIACGSGLAVELAVLRGATCAGIDASPRLVAVARDRSPEADIRVGDMHALPWPDATFDVVTSFRGIWGTTPAALDEVHRVLVPGGRVGLTVWGHLKASPGAWALAPFRLADAPAVANQAAMVALGRPGVGEQLLRGHRFHRRPPCRGAIRLGVRGSGELRTGARLHRARLRGDPHRGRGRVPGGRGPWRGAARAGGAPAPRRDQRDRLRRSERQP